jgi:glycosyltransferase involved in cell wall biosynthesis
MRSGLVDGFCVIEIGLQYSNSDRFLDRSLKFVAFSALTAWIALSRSYDLIFATSTPLTAAVPGILSRLIRRKPFVFEVRDLWPELPRAMGVITNPVVLWCMAVLEKMSYRSADHVIALAPGIVEGIRRVGGSDINTSMIPNGCDLNVFFPLDSGNYKVPGVERGDLVAAFTGVHGLANGLDAVLNAATVLKERGREDIKLVFVGAGMQKHALKNRAQDEGLAHCIFLDPMPKLDLAKLMQSVDIGLMILANIEAFYYGTSPNKFFDYIAGGKPVLCNYPGWVAEMLEEWQAGVSVPPEDPEAFAKALIELASDRPRLEAMSRQARALAEQEFDRDILSDRFVGVLESVASGNLASKA